jgi:cytochrome d ubiquinol oxidase subunit I
LLIVFCAVYVLILAFGILYICRLLRAGPVGSLVLPAVNAIANRSMFVVDPSALAESRRFAAGE